MAAFLQRLLVLLLALGVVVVVVMVVAGGRQELAGHLLGHQLRVDARFAGGCAFTDVAHETLEGLRRVPERTHTTVPEIVLEHFGLTLRSANGTFLMVHYTTHPST